jgi:NitT/TauT family transport system ATP-binding protein
MRRPGRFRQVYPHTLSGGMQQRVAIARTLALRPEGDPHGRALRALDAQTRTEMQELLLRIWDETANTVLFVTHDVDEAIPGRPDLIMCAGPGTIIEDLPVPFRVRASPSEADERVP